MDERSNTCRVQEGFPKLGVERILPYPGTTPPPDPGQLPHEVDAARDVSAFGEAVGGVTATEAALFSLLIKHRSACDQEENHSLRKCN